MTPGQLYRRDWNYKRKYGVSAEEVHALWQEQGGRCGICERTVLWEFEGKGNRDRLCVDHCHETGEVRGILCWSCNAGLGKLGDTVEALERAIRYLSD